MAEWGFEPRVIVAALALILGCAVPGIAQQEVDMGAAVERGIKANPGIRAARKELQGSEHGVQASKTAFAPSLNAGYSYKERDEAPRFLRWQTGTRKTWALHFNVHQPLFTGFRLLGKYKKAKLVRERNEARLERARLQLITKIQKNFLRLLAYKDKVRSASRAVERLEEHLRISREFYNAGVKPKVNVLEAKTDVSEARQDLLRARNGVKTQRARLNSLLGWDVNKQVHYCGQLSVSPVHMSLKECLRRARKERPEVRIAQKSVRIAGKEVKLASSSFYPDVGADFDYYRYGDDPQVDGSEFQEPCEWEMGINLSWELFQWGRTYHEYRQAKGKKESIRAELDNLLNDVAFGVKSAYLKLEESRGRVEVAGSGVREAREGYRMAQSRYKAQVGTNADVLDAQARLAQSEARLTRAKSDYLRALSELFAAMGKEEQDLLASGPFN